jgi:phospho-N-acetylmuramoyl-pentapeptide-transferase
MLHALSLWLRDAAHGTPWEEWAGPLRVFDFITFRSAGAAITALLLSLLVGGRFIAELRRLKFQQEYTDLAGADARLADARALKRGTPTMGGLLIIVVLDIAAVLWGRWNAPLQLTLLSVLVLAGLGFYDDWAKLTRQSGHGAPARMKLVVQVALACFIVAYLWAKPSLRPLVTSVYLPFVKHPVLTGALLAGGLIAVLAIVGSSNAVNLTDGMDGLAIGCTLMVSFVFLVFTYVAGNRIFADRLLIPYADGAGELTVFCAALLGAGLGFLWYNCAPAQVFMGDTGSLALGGALGIIAVLIHQPLLLPLAGGVFVAEAGSVLLQRGWFKYTRARHGAGRRLFRMAPLHHHFEKLGWPETRVVMRFYILSVLCALVALATLKLR